MSKGRRLVNPRGAEFQFFLNYHGPVSPDRAVYYAQTHTLLGRCAEGANALDFGPPFGVQCVSLQTVQHID